MRPGTYKLDWQETQSRASTGLGAGSSYCQRSWPFLPLPFCQASGGSYYLQSSHILQPVALTSTSRSPPSPTGSSSSWKECLSTPTRTFMEEEGGFPRHCLSSPPPLVLCAPRHTSARAHTHTHTCTRPPPQRFWRRDQAEARWGRGGHGRAGITQCPALTLPPTGDRQSAAEARLPSGVVTCVLCAGDREKGKRNRLAASGPCVCACLGTEMSAQPRGDAG